MKIRLATLDDLSACVHLLGVLFMQEAEFAPDPIKQKHGLLLILNQPELGHILVVELDGQVVGMVNLLYTVSTYLGAKVALLEDLVVEPDYRSQGLGRKLFQQALELAQRQGCQRITLLTDAHNLEAQSFYQKEGFSRSTMVVMRKT